MDALLTLLCNAWLTFLIGVPGADDIMLNYQSTSFHNALYARRLLGLKHARSLPNGWPECRLSEGQLRLTGANHPLLTAVAQGVQL